MTRRTRRDVLGLAAGTLGAAALSLSGGVAAQGGGAGGRGEPDYGGWLDGANNYEGTVDRRGQAEVTVEVGVESGSGPYGFAPAAVWVDPGATVRWEWTGDGGAHNVVAADGTFDSGDPVAEAGVHLSHTFERDGVYRYFCAPHRALGMKGAVAVGDVPRQTPTPTPTPTPEPRPTGEWLPAPPAADWPSRGFDPANTRYNPSTAGPVEGVRKVGEMRFRTVVWPPLLADGRLFVTVGYDDAHLRTLVLDAASGERLWRRAGGIVGATTGDAVYLTTTDGNVLCLDATFGTPRWERRVLGSRANALQLAGHRLVVAGTETVAVLDPATGDVRWRRRPTGRVDGVALDDDGTVYVSGDRHFGRDFRDPVLWVRAYDGAGRERWRHRRRSYPPTRPTVVGDTVYVGSGSYLVEAIDAASGDERWRAELGSVVTGLAVVPPGADADGAGGTVYAGCADHYLYAFDAGTGEEQWRTRTRSSVSAPVVAGGVVYALNAGVVRGVEDDGDIERDMAVQAFDGASGDRLWTVELGRQPLVSATPALFGGSLIVADGAVYANTNSTDRESELHVVAGEAARRSGGETGASTPGGGSSGFTAVGTALGLLGAAGLRRLRDSGG